MRVTLLSLFLGLLILGGFSAQAQPVSVNTIPEGVFTFSLAAAAQNPTTYLSLPLISDPLYTGAVSSTIAVTATTIAVDDAPAPFTASALSTPAAPYFVKFLSGAETGRVIKVTANTTNALTLDTTDNSSQTTALNTTGFAVAAGDSFEVFAGDTLASVFGSVTGSLVLNGGTSFFSADTIGIYSPAALKTIGYYFDTNAGFWKANGSATNVNNTVLYPYAGFSITRRSGEPALTFTLLGRVAEVAQLTKTTGSSAVVYGSTQYPADMTLSQLQFGPNWTKNASFFSADTVAIWNAGAIRFDSYYQLPDSTWRKSGVTGVDQSSFVIPAGTTLAILKRGTVSGATSFLQSVMPYSL